ncbi:MAG: hypothetical protein RR572_00035, partial [Raoultibacter sp.]
MGVPFGCAGAGDGRRCRFSLGKRGGSSRSRSSSSTSRSVVVKQREGRDFIGDQKRAHGGLGIHGRVGQGIGFLVIAAIDMLDVKMRKLCRQAACLQKQGLQIGTFNLVGPQHLLDHQFA